jgi:hypothetical protein
MGRSLVPPESHFVQFVYAFVICTLSKVFAYFQHLWGLPTEAEDRRELAHQDVLLGLTGGAMWGGGDDLYCDGQPVPPALTYCTACHAKRLLNCEILAIPAGGGGGILLKVHKTPTRPKSHKGRGRHSLGLAL